MTGQAHDPVNRGLIPRICEALFETPLRAAETAATGEVYEVTHSFVVNYVEIYNERVQDLLVSPTTASPGPSSSTSVSSFFSSPTAPAAALSPAQPSSNPNTSTTTTNNKPPTPLRVREHPKHGPYVDGASAFRVHSFEQVQALLDLGARNRKVSSTDMNATSSRSHALFTIHYTKSKRDVVTNVVVEQTSKLNLIDLAGSENAHSAGTTGARLKEGANINKSLLTLGLVIKALATKGKALVPYRDSVLTFLLKDSLGGNSKTTMLATIRPGLTFYEESLNTLRYADRAKSIVNVVVVHEDPLTKKIRGLHEQIEMLTKELVAVCMCVCMFVCACM